MYVRPLASFNLWHQLKRPDSGRSDTGQSTRTVQSN
jgi:hypothetical protein